MTDDIQSATQGDLLSKAPLFSRLGRKELKKLSSLCVPRTYQTGSIIIQEGATGLGLFIIASGRVEVYKEEGDSRISLAVMGQGEILGEMALIDDQPRSASAVALEPTECLLITRDSFQTLLRKDPEIIWCIVPTLAERVRDLQEKIIDLEQESLGIKGESAEETEKVPEESAGEDQLEKEDKRSSIEKEMTQGLRLEYALLMAGAEAIRGTARLMETFLRALADETELNEEKPRLADLVKDLPRGLVAAVKDALEEGEKIPERIVSKYRQNLARD